MVPRRLPGVRATEGGGRCHGCDSAAAYREVVHSRSNAIPFSNDSPARASDLGQAEYHWTTFMLTRSGCAGVVTTVALVSVLAFGSVALAQFGFGGFRGSYKPLPNIPYDGRFTFVRVRYDPAPGGYWPGRRPSWIHGYPLAEQNLMKIMNEVSFLGAHDEINTVTLDDPELFKYPIAYIIEVGWWRVTDREAAGLRAYLQKGGFLFVDDFKPPGWRGVPGGGWEPFAETMRRVLPDVQFIDMVPSDPVFHTFFEINALDQFPQARRRVIQGIFGITIAASG